MTRLVAQNNTKSQKKKNQQKQKQKQKQNKTKQKLFYIGSTSYSHKAATHPGLIGLEIAKDTVAFGVFGAFC